MKINYSKRTLGTSIAALTLFGGAVGSVGVMGAWGTSEAAANSTTAIAENAGTESATRSYDIDAVHTSVIFKIRHGTVSNFYGRFNEMSGSIDFDADKIENSSLNMTVQIGSIDTNNAKRDVHLKGADFFNARQYDTASFKSTGIKSNGDGTYTATGDFSFQGKTVELSADLHDVRSGDFNGKSMLGVEARFSIKRSDFGMTKYLNPSDPDSGPLGDTVEIIVAIEAVGK